LQQLGRGEEARAELAEVERLHRRDAQFAQANTDYNLGLQALEKGDLGAARSAFQSALRVKGDFAEAHTNLGAVLLKLGDTASAIGHFRAALDLKAGDARTYYNLSLALQKLGDRPAAEEARRRALELDPQLK